MKPRNWSDLITPAANTQNLRENRLHHYVPLCYCTMDPLKLPLAEQIDTYERIGDQVLGGEISFLMNQSVPRQMASVPSEIKTATREPVPGS